MKVLHIDYTKCIGCEACEKICAFLYKKPNIVMSKTDEGRVVPLYCRHCVSPGCVKACTRGAIVKIEDGAVLQQPALCAGCITKNCLKGCPFMGIYPTEKIEDAPNKCDLCLKQQEKGILPACISICPSNALSLKSHAEIKELPVEVKNADKEILQHIKTLRAKVFTKEAK